MVLDILGSLIAWFFLLAYYFKSISALYMATALQMTVAAIYEPSHSAIAPMIVFDEESLKKALTLSGLAWSVMTGVGSSIGGFAVGWVGISMCFVIDSVSYFTSAVFLWKLQGSYRATESTETIDTTSVPLSSSGTQCSLTSPPANAMDETGETNNEQSSFLSWKQLNNMTAEGLSYLRSKPWGPFVFLKFFAAIIYGAADVLNVSFSERGLDGNEMDGSSQRLGILFAFVGIGCFLGPIIADPFTNMDQPKSLERICLISYLSMAVGCWGLSKIQSFAWVCVFTAVRSAGSSVIWIDSSLLLQVSICLVNSIMF